jgi:hypothetical protein
VEKGQEWHDTIHYELPSERAKEKTAKYFSINKGASKNSIVVWKKCKKSLEFATKEQKVRLFDEVLREFN